MAILLYDILKEIVEDPLGDAGTLKNVLIKFVRIAIGGPLFGWFMASLKEKALFQFQFHKAVSCHAGESCNILFDLDIQ